MTKVTYWTCPSCKSSWPAATTVEAWRNHQRANLAHPGQRCSANELEPVEEEPPPCKSVVQFGGSKGKSALCYHSETDHPTFHEAESPIHESGTGVIVQWLGDDRTRYAHMISFVDEVTGKDVIEDDPRLIPSDLD